MSVVLLVYDLCMSMVGLLYAYCLIVVCLLYVGWFDCTLLVVAFRVLLCVKTLCCLLFVFVVCWNS